MTKRWNGPAALSAAGFVLSMTLHSGAAMVDSRSSTTGQEGLVIDHHAVAEFDRLSDDAIRAAARLRLMVRTASIGWNIDYGLNCLMNSFPDMKRRPTACDKGIPVGQVVYGAKYDRRNWKLEARGNPGWYGKVSDFIERVDGLAPSESFDVVGFNFNYGDGLPHTDLLEHFFKAAPNARMGNIAKLEALEKRHPGMVFVWWSMALARRSTPGMQQFNQRIRAYATEQNKVLFDIADIESHAPDGGLCTDSEGNGLEAICPDYTDERVAGHLNARGHHRAAKAVWVLMARLAADAK